MTKVSVLPHAELCPEGAQFEVQPGSNLCISLLENKIPIEHACEMSCACTTCHVIVRQGFNSLNSSMDKEDDLLDMAWGLTSQSRLSCQVKIGAEDLVIELPRYTINQARES